MLFVAGGFHEKRDRSPLDAVAPGLLWPQSPYHADIPKTWDESALANWVTPVAGLNVRPMHISSREYYSVPEYSLRSYPVYMAGREPAGYWDMLQQVGPKPLIEREKLRCHRPPGERGPLQSAARWRQSHPRQIHLAPAAAAGRADLVRAVLADEPTRHARLARSRKPSCTAR